MKVLNWNGGEVHAEEEEAFRLACAGFKEALAKHSGKLRYGSSGCLLPPLHAAINAKDDASTHLLLDGGMDPREVNHDGYTALHWAAWHGCKSIVETLLGGEHHDSLINARHRWDGTALHLAASFNQPTIVALLLKHPNIGINIETGALL